MIVSKLVLAVVGIIAIPFTAGLSAVAAGVGGGITGAAGGLTAGGAGLARYFIEKNKLGYVQDKWSSFCQRLKEELEKDPEKLKMLNSKLDFSFARLGVAGTEITSSVARAVGSGARQAGTTAARATATIGSAALNVVLIGFSLYDIVDGAIELDEKDGSPAGNSLRKLADSLDRLAEKEGLEDFAMALMTIVANCAK